jgi:hypothetical protein
LGKRQIIARICGVVIRSAVANLKIQDWRVGSIHELMPNSATGLEATTITCAEVELAIAQQQRG